MLPGEQLTGKRVVPKVVSKLAADYWATGGYQLIRQNAGQSG